MAGAAPSLPRKGEVEEEKKERKESRSAPRGHRDPRSETSQKSRREVKEDPYTASAKRRRSESADRHGRKRSRKTRSRTRRRSRTRSRHRSRQRRREEFPEASREKRSPKFEEVKKESPSSERKPKSGRVPVQSLPCHPPEIVGGGCQHPHQSPLQTGAIGPGLSGLIAEKRSLPRRVRKRSGLRAKESRRGRRTERFGKPITGVAGTETGGGSCSAPRTEKASSGWGRQRGSCLGASTRGKARGF